jgi:hypothetical protein
VPLSLLDNTCPISEEKPWTGLFLVCQPSLIQQTRGVLSYSYFGGRGKTWQ